MRLHAGGVCHSDLNAIDGTAETRCPAVLGHEGAGVVEAVGEGVALRPGTRVLLSWLPACGVCEECLREPAAPVHRRPGRRWTAGGLLDGTPRLSRDGEPSTTTRCCRRSPSAPSSPRAAASRCPDDVPFDVAALVGCAVTTGTGAVWRTAACGPATASRCSAAAASG